jgi:hypothetical protein
MMLSALVQRLNAFVDTLLGIDGILQSVTAAAAALFERYPQ